MYKLGVSEHISAAIASGAFLECVVSLFFFGINAADTLGRKHKKK